MLVPHELVTSLLKQALDLPDRESTGKTGVTGRRERQVRTDGDETSKTRGATGEDRSETAGT